MKFQQIIAALILLLAITPDAFSYRACNLIHITPAMCDAIGQMQFLYHSMGHQWKIGFHPSSVCTVWTMQMKPD
jgi:hypothetical protein